MLDGVRFVENNEIVREQVTALPSDLFLGTAEKHEEERVIDHDRVRGEQSFPGLLEKAAATLTAAFHRADVRLAAHLRPDFRVRLDREIAERSVRGGPRPIRDSRQLSRFRGGEQLAGLLDRALQPAWAKIILPAFHQRRLEFDRQNFLQDRDVLMEELLLQIDGVGGNDRLLFLRERVENRWCQISDRFSHARARLNDEMPFFLERLRYRYRHQLLLAPILEVLRAR